ncbi:toxin glutamine deamidase domain-containing protein [Lentzea sp. NPDC055074]
MSDDGDAVAGSSDGMDIQFDPTFDWLWILVVGQKAPRVDVAAARDLADTWRQNGVTLQELLYTLDTAAAVIEEAIGGDVGSAFRRNVDQLTVHGPALAALAENQAGSLENLALNVESSNYSMMLEIAFFAASIIWALASPFTAPLVPSFVTGARVAIKEIFDRLGAWVLVLRQILEEGASEIAQDALVQITQFIEGNRKSWDEMSTVISGIAGMAAGGLISVAHLTGAKYAPKFENTMLFHGITEGFAEGIVGLGVAGATGGDLSDAGFGAIGGTFSGGVQKGFDDIGDKIDSIVNSDVTLPDLDAFTPPVTPGPRGGGSDGGEGGGPGGGFDDGPDDEVGGEFEGGPHGETDGGRGGFGGDDDFSGGDDFGGGDDIGGGDDEVGGIDGGVGDPPVREVPSSVEGDVVPPTTDLPPPVGDLSDVESGVDYLGGDHGSGGVVIPPVPLALDKPLTHNGPVLTTPGPRDPGDQVLGDRFSGPRTSDGVDVGGVVPVVDPPPRQEHEVQGVVRPGQELADVEVPVVQQPGAEVPVQQPGVEVPVTQQPGIEVPGVNPPAGEVLGVDSPHTDRSLGGVPETHQPVPHPPGGVLSDGVLSDGDPPGGQVPGHRPVEVPPTPVNGNFTNQSPADGSADTTAPPPQPVAHAPARPETTGSPLPGGISPVSDVRGNVPLTVEPPFSDVTQGSAAPVGPQPQPVSGPNGTGRDAVEISPVAQSGAGTRPDLDARANTVVPTSVEAPRFEFPVTEQTTPPAEVTTQPPAEPATNPATEPLSHRLPLTREVDSVPAHQSTPAPATPQNGYPRDELAKVPAQQRGRTQVAPGWPAPVRSAFEVRRARQGDDDVVEVTVFVDVDPEHRQSAEVRHQAVEDAQHAVDEFFNRPDLRLRNGELLRFRILQAGENDPVHHVVHLDPEAEVDQNHWRPGQFAAFTAHEFGHMVGLVEEYGNRPQAIDVEGTLMGRHVVRGQDGDLEPQDDIRMPQRYVDVLARTIGIDDTGTGSRDQSLYADDTVTPELPAGTPSPKVYTGTTTPDDVRNALPEYLTESRSLGLSKQATEVRGNAVDLLRQLGRLAPEVKKWEGVDEAVARLKVSVGDTLADGGLRLTLKGDGKYHELQVKSTFRWDDLTVEADGDYDLTAKGKHKRTTEEAASTKRTGSIVPTVQGSALPGLVVQAIPRIQVSPDEDDKGERKRELGSSSSMDFDKPVEVDVAVRVDFRLVKPDNSTVLTADTARVGLAVSKDLLVTSGALSTLNSVDDDISAGRTPAAQRTAELARQNVTQVNAAPPRVRVVEAVVVKRHNAPGTAQPPPFADQVITLLGKDYRKATAVGTDGRGALNEFLGESKIASNLPKMAVHSGADPEHGWVTSDPLFKGRNRGGFELLPKTTEVQMRAVARWVKVTDSTQTRKLTSKQHQHYEHSGESSVSRGVGLGGFVGGGADIAPATLVAGGLTGNAAVDKTASSKFTRSSAVKQGLDVKGEVVRYELVYDIQVRRLGTTTPWTLDGAVGVHQWTGKQDAEDAGIVTRTAPAPAFVTDGARTKQGPSEFENGQALLGTLEFDSGGIVDKAFTDLLAKHPVQKGRYLDRKKFAQHLAHRKENKQRLVQRFGSPDIDKGKLTGKVAEALATGAKLSDALSDAELTLLVEHMAGPGLAIPLKQEGWTHERDVTVVLKASVGNLEEGPVLTADEVVGIYKNNDVISLENKQQRQIELGTGPQGRTLAPFGGQPATTTPFGVLLLGVRGARAWTSEVAQTIEGKRSTSRRKGDTLKQDGKLGDHQVRQFKATVTITGDVEYRQRHNKKIRKLSFGRRGRHAPATQNLASTTLPPIDARILVPEVLLSDVGPAAAPHVAPVPAPTRPLAGLALKPHALPPAMPRSFDDVEVVSFTGAEDLQRSAADVLGDASDDDPIVKSRNEAIAQAINARLSPEALKSDARLFNRTTVIDSGELKYERRSEDLFASLGVSFKPKLSARQVTAEEFQEQVKELEGSNKTVGGGGTTDQLRAYVVAVPVLTQRQYTPAAGGVNEVGARGVFVLVAVPYGITRGNAKSDQLESGEKLKVGTGPQRMVLARLDVEATVVAEAQHKGNLSFGAAKPDPSRTAGEVLDLPESMLVWLTEDQFAELSTGAATTPAPRTPDLVTSVEPPRSLRPGETTKPSLGLGGVLAPIDLTATIDVLRMKLAAHPDVGKDLADRLLPDSTLDQKNPNIAEIKAFLSDPNRMMNSLLNGDTTMAIRLEDRTSGRTYELTVDANLTATPDRGEVKNLSELKVSVTAKLGGETVKSRVRALLTLIASARPALAIRERQGPATENGRAQGQIGAGLGVEFVKGIRDRKKTVETGSEYTHSASLKGPAAVHRGQLDVTVRIRRHGKALAEVTQTQDVDLTKIAEESLPKPKSGGRLGHHQPASGVRRGRLGKADLTTWRTTVTPGTPAQQLPGLGTFWAEHFFGDVEALHTHAKEVLEHSGVKITPKVQRAIKAAITPASLRAALSAGADGTFKLPLPRNLARDLEIHLRLPERPRFASTSANVEVTSGRKDTTEEKVELKTGGEFEVIETAPFGTGGESNTASQPAGAPPPLRGAFEDRAGTAQHQRTNFTGPSAEQLAGERSDKSSVSDPVLGSAHSTKDEVTRAVLADVEFRFVARRRKSLLHRDLVSYQDVRVDDAYALRMSDTEAATMTGTTLSATLVTATTDLAAKGKAWVDAEKAALGATAELRTRERALDTAMLADANLLRELDLKVKLGRRAYNILLGQYERARTTPGAAPAESTSRLTDLEQARVRLTTARNQRTALRATLTAAGTDGLVSAYITALEQENATQAALQTAELDWWQARERHAAEVAALQFQEEVALGLSTAPPPLPPPPPPPPPAAGLIRRKAVGSGAAPRPVAAPGTAPASFTIVRNPVGSGGAHTLPGTSQGGASHGTTSRGGTSSGHGVNQGRSTGAPRRTPRTTVASTWSPEELRQQADDSRSRYTRTTVQADLYDEVDHAVRKLVPSPPRPQGRWRTPAEQERVRLHDDIRAVVAGEHHARGRQAAVDLAAELRDVHGLTGYRGPFSRFSRAVRSSSRRTAQPSGGTPSGATARSAPPEASAHLARLAATPVTGTDSDADAHLWLNALTDAGVTGVKRVFLVGERTHTALAVPVSTAPDGLLVLDPAVSPAEPLTVAQWTAAHGVELSDGDPNRLVEWDLSEVPVMPEFSYGPVRAELVIADASSFSPPWMDTARGDARTRARFDAWHGSLTAEGRKLFAELSGAMTPSRRRLFHDHFQAADDGWRDRLAADLGAGVTHDLTPAWDDVVAGARAHLARLDPDRVGDLMFTSGDDGAARVADALGSPADQELRDVAAFWTDVLGRRQARQAVADFAVDHGVDSGLDEDEETVSSGSELSDTSRDFALFRQPGWADSSRYGHTAAEQMTEAFTPELDPAPRALTDLLHSTVPPGTRFAEPGTFARLINGSVLGQPGRLENCVDCAIAFLETWRGRPRTAGAGVVELGAKVQYEMVRENLGHHPEWVGRGPSALAQVIGALREAGHGAGALVLGDAVSGNGHAWNLVNHNGTVYVVDPQFGTVEPAEGHVHPAMFGVYALVLDADGEPITGLRLELETGSVSTDGTDEPAQPDPETFTAPGVTVTGDGVRIYQRPFASEADDLSEAWLAEVDSALDLLPRLPVADRARAEAEARRIVPPPDGSLFIGRQTREQLDREQLVDEVRAVVAHTFVQHGREVAEERGAELRQRFDLRRTRALGLGGVRPHEESTVEKSTVEGERGESSSAAEVHGQEEETNAPEQRDVLDRVLAIPLARQVFDDEALIRQGQTAHLHAVRGLDVLDGRVARRQADLPDPAQRSGGTKPSAHAEALKLAVVAGVVARVAAESFNDPVLTSLFARRIITAHADDLGSPEVVRVAAALVSDDPLDALLRGGIDEAAAAARVAEIAERAGLTPQETVELLAWRYEAEMLSYTENEVAHGVLNPDPDTTSNFGLADLPGEISPEYYRRVVRQPESPAWPGTTLDLTLTDEAAARIAALRDLVSHGDTAEPSPPADPEVARRSRQPIGFGDDDLTGSADRLRTADDAIAPPGIPRAAAMTAKQHQRLKEVRSAPPDEQRRAEVVWWLQHTLGVVDAGTAARVLARAEQWFATAPITISFAARTLFGSDHKAESLTASGAEYLPASRLGVRHVDAGTSFDEPEHDLDVLRAEAARLETAYADAWYAGDMAVTTGTWQRLLRARATLRSAEQAESRRPSKARYLAALRESDPSLKFWTQANTDPYRGDNYPRWRRDKDDLATGRKGFVPGENAVFGAVNLNYRQTRAFEGAQYYGESHLLLRQDIRQRAYYSVNSSGVPRIHLSDLLHDMYLAGRNEMVEAVLRNALGLEGITPQGFLFLETHVFGGLRFDRDVAELSLPPADLPDDVRARVETFAAAHGIPVTTDRRTPQPGAPLTSDVVLAAVDLARDSPEWTDLLAAREELASAQSEQQRSDADQRVRDVLGRLPEPAPDPDPLGDPPSAVEWADRVAAARRFLGKLAEDDHTELTRTVIGMVPSPAGLLFIGAETRTPEQLELQRKLDEARDVVAHTLRRQGPDAAGALVPKLVRYLGITRLTGLVGGARDSRPEAVRSAGESSTASTSPEAALVDEVTAGHLSAFAGLSHLELPDEAVRHTVAEYGVLARTGALERHELPQDIRAQLVALDTALAEFEGDQAVVRQARDVVQDAVLAAALVPVRQRVVFVRDGGGTEVDRQEIRPITAAGLTALLAELTSAVTGQTDPFTAPGSALRGLFVPAAASLPVRLAHLGLVNLSPQARDAVLHSPVFVALVTRRATVAESMFAAAEHGETGGSTPATSLHLARTAARAAGARHGRDAVAEVLDELGHVERRAVDLVRYDPSDPRVVDDWREVAEQVHEQMRKLAAIGTAAGTRGAIATQLARHGERFADGPLSAHLATPRQRDGFWQALARTDGAEILVHGHVTRLRAVPGASGPLFLVDDGQGTHPVLLTPERLAEWATGHDVELTTPEVLDDVAPPEPDDPASSREGAVFHLVRGEIPVARLVLDALDVRIWQQQSVREHVVRVLDVLAGRQAGSGDGVRTGFRALRDPVHREALQLAAVTENVARAVAESFNDPLLRPVIARRILTAHQASLGTPQAVRVAVALVSDDPLTAFLHGDIDLPAAFTRIDAVAERAGLDVPVVVDLLQRRYEAEMLSYTSDEVERGEVHRDPDAEGNFWLAELPGEISTDYFERVVRTREDGAPATSLDRVLSDFAVAKFAEMTDLAATRRPAHRQAPVPGDDVARAEPDHPVPFTDTDLVLARGRLHPPGTVPPPGSVTAPGLTAAQYDHVRRVRSTPTGQQRRDELVELLRPVLGGVDTATAARVLRRAEEWFETAPVTISFHSSTFFGDEHTAATLLEDGAEYLPAALVAMRVVNAESLDALHHPEYDLRALRFEVDRLRDELEEVEPGSPEALRLRGLHATALGVLATARAAESRRPFQLRHLRALLRSDPGFAVWTQVNTNLARGYNYPRWRRDKDDRHTGRRGLGPAEAPVFGAVNLNYEHTRAFEGGPYFGASHLLLKQEVRQRALYSTRAQNPPRAHLVDVLLDLRHEKEVLEAVVRNALGLPGITPQEALGLEVQVFGGVRFDRDVRELSLPDDLPQEVRGRAEEFARRHGIPITAARPEPVAGKPITRRQVLSALDGDQASVPRSFRVPRKGARTSGFVVRTPRGTAPEDSAAWRAEVDRARRFFFLARPGRYADLHERARTLVPQPPGADTGQRARLLEDVRMVVALHHLDHGRAAATARATELAVRFGFSGNDPEWQDQVRSAQRALGKLSVQRHEAALRAAISLVPAPTGSLFIGQRSDEQVAREQVLDDVRAVVAHTYQRSGMHAAAAVAGRLRSRFGLRVVRGLRGGAPQDEQEAGATDTGGSASSAAEHTSGAVLFPRDDAEIDKRPVDGAELAGRVVRSEAYQDGIAGEPEMPVEVVLTGASPSSPREVFAAGLSQGDEVGRFRRVSRLRVGDVRWVRLVDAYGTPFGVGFPASTEAGNDVRTDAANSTVHSRRIVAQRDDDLPVAPGTEPEFALPETENDHYVVLLEKGDRLVPFDADDEMAALLLASDVLAKAHERQVRPHLVVATNDAASGHPAKSAQELFTSLAATAGPWPGYSFSGRTRLNALSVVSVPRDRRFTETVPSPRNVDHVVDGSVFGFPSGTGRTATGAEVREFARALREGRTSLGSFAPGTEPIVISLDGDARHAGLRLRDGEMVEIDGARLAELLLRLPEFVRLLRERPEREIVLVSADGGQRVNFGGLGFDLAGGLRAAGHFHRVHAADGGATIRAGEVSLAGKTTFLPVSAWRAGDVDTVVLPSVDGSFSLLVVRPPGEEGDRFVDEIAGWLAAADRTSLRTFLDSQGTSTKAPFDPSRPPVFVVAQGTAGGFAVTRRDGQPATLTSVELGEVLRDLGDLREIAGTDPGVDLVLLVAGDEAGELPEFARAMAPGGCSRRMHLSPGGVSFGTPGRFRFGRSFLVVSAIETEPGAAVSFPHVREDGTVHGSAEEIYRSAVVLAAGKVGDPAPRNPGLFRCEAATPVPGSQAYWIKQAWFEPVTVFGATDVAVTATETGRKGRPRR